MKTRLEVLLFFQQKHPKIVHPGIKIIKVLPGQILGGMHIIALIAQKHRQRFHIAAAGVSSRKRDFKSLLKVENLSVIERIIINFQQAEVSPIVVVTGYNAK